MAEWLPDVISRRLGGLGNTLNIADLKAAAGIPLHQLDVFQGVRLPGTAGNYISTPDSPANSVTGDIDIRVKLAMDDWTPASFGHVLAKWNLTASQASWRLRIETSGLLGLSWTADGSTNILKNSTVATGFTDGSVKWIRATLDVDNGAAQNEVKFYTSDDGASWTQLGATVTTAGVTSIFDSTASVSVGARSDGGEAITGNVFYAEVRNGIDGPVVASFDPANPSGWTFNGTGWSWV